MEDIKALPRVLQKIVDARGCIVKDKFLRTGRLEVRSDGKGILKNKPRSRQRKATLVFPPIHPDHRQAYDEILAIARANPALDLANALNVVAIAEAEEEVAEPQPEIGNDLELEEDFGIGIDIQLANDDELLADGDDESMQALDIVDLP